jgi:hypothetical protein
MPPSSRINVKLRSGIDPPAALAQLTRIPGVRRAAQVFPDDPEPEFRRLVLVEVERVREQAELSSAVLYAVRLLDVADYVEFAPTRSLRALEPSSTETV